MDGMLTGTSCIVRSPAQSEYTAAIRPIVAGVLLSVCLVAVSHAQTAANVAVVINQDSPASIEVGEYYARKRAISESNIIRLRTAPEELISRAAYIDAIERPIAVALSDRGLQDRILYIVLTKGVPLRISGSAGLNTTGASVDSELTLLYRKLTGRSVITAGRVDNPYFLRSSDLGDARPFSHRDHDIYLVTRLDAFTVQEATALVDRALAPATEGRIILDRRGGATAATADLWLVAARTRLTGLGRSTRVDLVEDPVPDDGPVLGYYSWGSSDPLNGRRRLGLHFTAGSLAATLAGTDARTFATPPEGWQPAVGSADRSKWFAETPQSLIADLIRDGATGAAGNVTEPLLASALRPQVLFPAYLSGFNLAEAFYLALPHLSWQGVIVGDPLCRPFAGRTLTSAEIDAGVDDQTGLPGLFAKRRAEIVRALLPGGSPAVIALIVRAEAQLAADNKDAARGSFEELTKIAPDQPAAYLQLALMDEQAGAFERAMDRYRRVLQLQPRNAVALNNLAFRLASQNPEATEALPLARRAAALAPQDPKVLDTLGWILYLRGAYGEAAGILADAVRKDQGTAEIRLHAAIVAAAVGSYTVAESHLKDALRLRPQYESRDDVRELREKLQKRR